MRVYVVVVQYGWDDTWVDSVFADKAEAEAHAASLYSVETRLVTVTTSASVEEHDVVGLP